MNPLFEKRPRNFGIGQVIKIFDVYNKDSNELQGGVKGAPPPCEHISVLGGSAQTSNEDKNLFHLYF